MILIHMANCRHAKFIESAAGKEVEKRLYSETLAEMHNYTNVPSELLVKG